MRTQIDGHLENTVCGVCVCVWRGMLNIEMKITHSNILEFLVGGKFSYAL